MKLSTLFVSLLLLVGACAADAPDPSATQDQGLIVVGQQCGSRVCPKNTHCCNASCGACVPPGVECTQQACKAEEAESMTAEEAADFVIIGSGQCGSKVCGVGTFCCNRSCSTCAPFGAECTQQICNATE